MLNQDSATRYGMVRKQMMSELADAARSKPVWAIVDPASYPQAWHRFGKIRGAGPARSLFAATAQALDPRVAPLLLAISASDSELIGQLIDVAVNHPAVLWLASHLPQDPLLALLGAKLAAELLDLQHPITLRYYDPRVLPQLFEVLKDGQMSVLHHGIASWWWFDRLNRVRRYDTNAALAAPVGAESVIRLDAQQTQMLLDASFADRVLRLVEQGHGSALEPFDRVERHAIALRMIERASRLKLISEHDVANYLVVSLFHGEGFEAEPPWNELLPRVQTGVLSFTDAIGMAEDGLTHEA